jgi:hypothetical protein
MRAIQYILPSPRHTEVMRIFVQAKPDVAWEKVRHLDLSSVRWVRFLFDLRTIAELFHKSNTYHPVDRRLGIEQITAEQTGFMILHEERGREVVVGAIGQFWHLQIPFARIDTNQFTDFNEPGWGKVAWSFTVEPYLNGSTICLELRTTATDDESWSKLNRYYHFIGLFSQVIRRTGMAQIEKELKRFVRPDDGHKWLRGDEAMKGTKYVMTDNIDIEASPSIVWRYLMQLGCDRGGWYSIDVLDHGGVKSTDCLVDVWPDRRVGDRIAATPKHDNFFEVLEVSKERYLVLGGETKKENGIFKMSWTFALEPIGDDATHLVVRTRMIMSPKVKEWFMGNILYPPIHGLMETVQLRTIKHLAEREARGEKFQITNHKQQIDSKKINYQINIK